MKNGYEIRGATTFIFLKHGRVTLIDTQDLPIADRYPGTWHAVYCKGTKSYYVEGTIWYDSKAHKIRLHREVFGNPVGQVIDHINHDTLDNRRSCNLRAVKHKDNAQNRKFIRNNTQSGFNGITKTHNGKWAVRIVKNGKQIHCGVFEDLDKAVSVSQAKRAEILPFSEEAMGYPCDHELIEPLRDLTKLVNARSPFQAPISLWWSTYNEGKAHIIALSGPEGDGPNGEVCILPDLAACPICGKRFAKREEGDTV